ALKPLKFALSLTLFFGTMAVLVPKLGVGAGTRQLLAWVLAATLAVETALIVIQAARGTSSHFNMATPLDAAIWRTMAALIVVASIAFVITALIATFRPLASVPVVAFAWRASLWIFLLSI